VVTHGKLAEELVSAARIIVGGKLDVRHLSIGWNDDVDLAREQVRRAIAETDRGHGVLVLTDMFGGTPTNLCISFLAREKVEIVTGVSLPMIVKTANLAAEAQEGLSLRQVAERVAERGRDSVIVAAGMLEPDAEE
jgi:PTS system mannose-specific IIA component